MARPREFDETVALDAALERFWSQGYETTSVRDLAEAMGISVASLYNSFGDKRALYRKALDHYVETGLGARLRRYGALTPRQAIERYFADILDLSLDDPDHKGCMVVNAALDIAQHDAEMREAVTAILTRIEGFFRDILARGQADGSIARAWPAEDLARHLHALAMGLRVLARIRPERALLEGAIRPALARLDPP